MPLLCQLIFLCKKNLVYIGFSELSTPLSFVATQQGLLAASKLARHIL
jgi:hypothetical protein